jgi:hypothetical protein
MAGKGIDSLPGEPHGLGLQMAALVLGVVGCRVLNLATETPVPEMARLARDLNARVVAKGLLVIQDLGQLDAWGRRLAADGTKRMVHGR